ncbi:histone [Candidatus Woesearchaeota archaeon CG08_land_8_20_14_0_20_47_9]|nr:MAG: histone [Candidatus Woesearchaeota archaeon CG1_02_47_18]PIO03956.1 MAG: histone [Candidatus Woesearchaeota archaeon CG08_land_8_20_14_0_20_47_9]HII30090.1 histone family protein [Candidatus Woesearchaeota archaeon]
MVKRLIPLAAMEKIMKRAGADRVSDKAKEAMKDYLERYAEEVARSAWLLATHAGRKTVKKEDIELAVK